MCAIKVLIALSLGEGYCSLGFNQLKPHIKQKDR